ncbi:MAG: sigma-70 family RNA polymerase sigma factor [Firmicutes bacterium]|nr:sigma-70 family RNA polymerase sigma factor [Bacillota bacterium]
MNREYLEDYRALVLEIDLLEEERQKLSTQLLTPRTYKDMPRVKGGYQDPVGEIATKLADLRTLIDKKLDIMIDMKKKTEESMQKLSPESRNIMRMRYMLGYSWEQMARKMNFTYQWILILHKRAMKEWEINNVCSQEKLKGA